RTRNRRSALRPLPPRTRLSRGRARQPAFLRRHVRQSDPAVRARRRRPRGEPHRARSTRRSCRTRDRDRRAQARGARRRRRTMAMGRRARRGEPRAPWRDRARRRHVRRLPRALARRVPRAVTEHLLVAVWRGVAVPSTDLATRIVDEWASEALADETVESCTVSLAEADQGVY